MAATKLINQYNLATGNLLSDAIPEVGDLVVHIKVSGATTDKKVKYTLKAKDGDSDYDNVRNIDVQSGDPRSIQFATYGNSGYRETINSIQAEFVKILVEPETGADGMLDLWYTKADKTTL